MPTSDDIPVFGAAAPDAEMPDRTPLAFKVIGYDKTYQPQEFIFHAMATASPGLLFDIASSTDARGNIHPSMVSKFFAAAIVKEDQDRWSDTVHDSDLYFTEEALTGIAEYLSSIYINSGSPVNRPTKPLSVLQGGRGKTGTKSTADAASLESTSSTGQ